MLSIVVRVTVIAAEQGGVQWWGTTNLLHCIMESWVLRFHGVVLSFLICWTLVLYWSPTSYFHV